MATGTLAHTLARILAHLHCPSGMTWREAHGLHACGNLISTAHAGGYKAPGSSVKCSAGGKGWSLVESSFQLLWGLDHSWPGLRVIRCFIRRLSGGAARCSCSAASTLTGSGQPCTSCRERTSCHCRARGQVGPSGDSKHASSRFKITSQF